MTYKSKQLKNPVMFGKEENVSNDRKITGVIL